MVDPIGGGGGGVEHNIFKYDSKVVYFQNTTISKTYVYYFTIIISVKTDKHNGVWLIFISWIDLCLRCIAYLRVKNLHNKMLKKLILHEPFSLLYYIY